MNTNNWRLTADVYAVIPIGRNSIYLAAIEKKSYLAEVEKLASLEGRSCTTTRIEINEFKVKVENDPSTRTTTVFIKSALFPSSEWYELKNFDDVYLINMLLSVPSKNGDFGEEAFEAIFQVDNSQVSFTHPNMTNYRECMLEFKRRMNCELNGKTTKLIPGHRYDTPEETRYLLCKVKTRKMKSGSSKFIEDEKDTTSGYLYVNELPEGVTKVSEVLRMGVFDSPDREIKRCTKTNLPVIKLSRTNGAMSEGGEVIVDDYSGNFSDYWEDIVNNNLSLADTMLDSFSEMETVSGAYEAMSIYSENSTTESSTKLLGRIIHHTLISMFKEYWDRGSGRYSFSTLAADKENIENSIKNTSSYIIDTNVDKTEYYEDMFKFFKVNKEEVAISAINDWRQNLLTMTSDFNTYTKYIEYFSLRQAYSDWQIRERVNSTNYSLSVITLEEKFGADSELKDIIIEIANYTKSVSGKNTDSFSIYNVGTKKQPKLYIDQTITLQDILKYKKGVENLSESLKNEIMSKKFVSCHLEYDIDRKLD